MNNPAAAPCATGYGALASIDTTAGTVPAPPEGLEEAGTELWVSMHTVFDFTEEPDKLAILEQACRTQDTITVLEADHRGKSMTATGSARQLTIHPLIAEIRVQRSTLANLLKALRLPEQPPVPPVAPRRTGGVSQGWRKQLATA